MPRVPARRFVRRLSLEQLERRDVLSVTFVDSGQAIPLVGDGFGQSVALDDLDGDGDLDAFLANNAFRDNEFSNRNTVWLNDGGGALVDSGQLLGKSRSVAVALGDLDADGDVDAFVANYLDGDDRVWLNDGHGRFVDSGQTIGTPVGGTAIQRLALADVDGDDDLDALVLRSHISNESEIWLNDGEGNYTEGQELGILWHAMDDLDGDGDLDLVAWARGGFEVWLNNGAGSFEVNPQMLEASSSPSAAADYPHVAVADVDSDGDNDLMTFCACDEQNQSRVWLNDGDGNFSNSGQELGDGLVFAFGDLDRDGDLDALVLNREGDRPPTIRLNDGTGFFQEEVLNAEFDATRSIRQVNLGDLDGDGDLDAFLGTLHGTMVWRNVGDGTPAPGDANRDLQFNQLDIVQVLQSAKYLTGEPATWEEGDWNADGVFDQKDIVAALATGNYLQGSYAAVDAVMADQGN